MRNKCLVFSYKKYFSSFFILTICKRFFFKFKNIKKINNIDVHLNIIMI